MQHYVKKKEAQNLVFFSTLLLTRVIVVLFCFLENLKTVVIILFYIL